jgi:thiol-disulfide isomerase/thioredoxin
MRILILAAGQLLFPLSSQPQAASLHVPVITQVNEPVHAFTYRSLDTKVHQLSELKGKVVLIDFWGTWCAGCVEEMPTIERLYTRYQKDPQVAFVIVSQNDTLDKVREFVARNHFNLPFYYIGSENVPAPLSPQAWPSTYFISADGILRGEYFGGGDWSDESVFHYIEKLKRDYPAKRK